MATRRFNQVCTSLFVAVLISTTDVFSLPFSAVLFKEALSCHKECEQAEPVPGCFEMGAIVDDMSGRCTCSCLWCEQQTRLRCDAFAPKASQQCVSYGKDVIMDPHGAWLCCIPCLKYSNSTLDNQNNDGSKDSEQRTNVGGKQSEEQTGDKGKQSEKWINDGGKQSEERSNSESKLTEKQHSGSGSGSGSGSRHEVTADLQERPTGQTDTATIEIHTTAGPEFGKEKNYVVKTVENIMLPAATPSSIGYKTGAQPQPATTSLDTAGQLVKTSTHISSRSHTTSQKQFTSLSSDSLVMKNQIPTACRLVCSALEPVPGCFEMGPGLDSKGNCVCSCLFCDQLWENPYCVDTNKKSQAQCLQYGDAVADPSGAWQCCKPCVKYENKTREEPRQEIDKTESCQEECGLLEPVIGCLEMAAYLKNGHCDCTCVQCSDWESPSCDYAENTCVRFGSPRMDPGGLWRCCKPCEVFFNATNTLGSGTVEGSGQDAFPYLDEFPADPVPSSQLVPFEHKHKAALDSMKNAASQKYQNEKTPLFGDSLKGAAASDVTSSFPTAVRHVVTQTSVQSNILNLCSAATCPPYQVCRVVHGQATCHCQPKCPLYSRPVCGSDGKTYFNQCALHRHACKHNELVHIRRQGACAGFSPEATGPG